MPRVTHAAKAKVSKPSAPAHLSSISLQPQLGSQLQLIPPSLQQIQADAQGPAVAQVEDAADRSPRLDGRPRRSRSVPRRYADPYAMAATPTSATTIKANKARHLPPAPLFDGSEQQTNQPAVDGAPAVTTSSAELESEEKLNLMLSPQPAPEPSTDEIEEKAEPQPKLLSLSELPKVPLAPRQLLQLSDQQLHCLTLQVLEAQKPFEPLAPSELSLPTLAQHVEIADPIPQPLSAVPIPCTGSQLAGDLTFQQAGILGEQYMIQSCLETPAQTELRETERADNSAATVQERHWEEEEVLYRKRLQSEICEAERERELDFAQDNAAIVAALSSSPTPVSKMPGRDQTNDSVTLLGLAADAPSTVPSPLTPASPPHKRARQSSGAAMSGDPNTNEDVWYGSVNLSACWSTPSSSESVEACCPPPAHPHLILPAHLILVQPSPEAYDFVEQCYEVMREALKNLHESGDFTTSEMEGGFSAISADEASRRVELKLTHMMTLYKSGGQQRHKVT
jgi:hypothetical protein